MSQPIQIEEIFDKCFKDNDWVQEAEKEKWTPVLFQTDANVPYFHLYLAGMEHGNDKDSYSNSVVEMMKGSLQSKSENVSDNIYDFRVLGSDTGSAREFKLDISGTQDACIIWKWTSENLTARVAMYSSKTSVKMYDIEGEQKDKFVHFDLPDLDDTVLVSMGSEGQEESK